MKGTTHVTADSAVADDVTHSDVINHPLWVTESDLGVQNVKVSSFR